jgi:hypothetical protein
LAIFEPLCRKHTISKIFFLQIYSPFYICPFPLLAKLLFSIIFVHLLNNKNVFMKRILFFGLLTLTSLSSLISQNAIVGSGFRSGWGANCTDNSFFGYFSASAGTTFTSGALTPNGTGNQFWRLAVGWSSSFYQVKQGSSGDVAVTPGTKYNLNMTCTSTGAMSYNVGSTSNRYVFKTLNAGTAPTGTWVFFEVQGALRSVTGVGRNPAGIVYGADAVTITATLDAAFNTGQAAFLRYTTTSDFSASTVVKMTGSGTTYSATIPAVGVNTTVRYYVFTSGDVASVAHGDADLYTIDLNNNSGANYQYTTASVLSVDIANLSVDTKTGANQITWSTSSEKDNLYFDIERSTNATNFTSIGQVASKGNSQTVRNYSFIDEKPAAGINYYRLKMVDVYGKATFSKVVSVNNGGKSGRLSLAPNPARNEMRISTTIEREGDVTIQILDVLGRVVLNEKRSVVQGDNQLTINIEDLANGTYFLNVDGAVTRFQKQ